MHIVEVANQSVAGTASADLHIANYHSIQTTLPRYRHMWRCNIHAIHNAGTLVTRCEFLLPVIYDTDHLGVALGQCIKQPAASNNQRPATDIPL